MSNVDKYIDYHSYWYDEIDCQLEILEDFEPELIECNYHQVRSFMDCNDKELILQDCCLDKGKTIIVFGIGCDEEGVSMLFVIGEDDLIECVEYR